MICCNQYPDLEEDRIKQQQIVQLLLLEAGQQDNEGWTAMMRACQNLNADVVELLYGMEAGIVNNERNTAFLIACA